MPSEWSHLWVLALAAGALAGWWLTLRPSASYRGLATPMSFLIITMAVLMCVLALRGQSKPVPPAPAPQVALRI